MVKETLFTILDSRLSEIEVRLKELSNEMEKLHKALAYVKERGGKYADLTPRNISLLTEAFVSCDREVKTLKNKWNRIKKISEMLLR